MNIHFSLHIFTHKKIRLRFHASGLSLDEIQYSSQLPVRDGSIAVSSGTKSVVSQAAVTAAVRAGTSSGEAAA